MPTLQGINISHLGKRKIIFKMPFFGDILPGETSGFRVRCTPGTSPGSPTLSSSHLNLLQVQVKLADCLEKAGCWEGGVFETKNPNNSAFFFWDFLLG